MLCWWWLWLLVQHFKSKRMVSTRLMPFSCWLWYSGQWRCAFCKCHTVRSCINCTITTNDKMIDNKLCVSFHVWSYCILLVSSWRRVCILWNSHALFQAYCTFWPYHACTCCWLFIPYVTCTLSRGVPEKWNLRKMLIKRKKAKLSAFWKKNLANLAK